MKDLHDRIVEGDFNSKLPYVARREDKAAYEAHIKDCERLGQEFKAALFDHLGIQDNPKKEKLYKLVCEDRDTDGDLDALLMAEKLVDLIK